MATKKAPPVKCVGAEDWKEPSGRGSDLVPKRGIFRLDFTEIEVQESKAGNWMLVFDCVVRDQDKACDGRRIVFYKSYTGNVSRGKHEGDPNVYQIYKVMRSAGASREAIAKLDGKSIDVDKMIANLRKLGGCYAQLEPEEDDNGVWRSSPVFFVSEEDYEKRKSHHEDLPAGVGGSAKATKKPAAETSEEEDEGDDPADIF